jgi:hypothetical protein
VNNELVYARVDLQKALKEGVNSNISTARKRISWLEDRVDNLLGKRRQRVSNVDKISPCYFIMWLNYYIELICFRVSMLA